MVSGQISIAQTSAYALMDTGASHSFISASFVEKLNRRPEPMPVICGVSLPLGEDMLVRTWVRAVPVWVEGRELMVDLLVLDLHEYDVIFGMDWLTKYGAVINCKRRKVVFTLAGEEPFEFKGTSREKKCPMIFCDEGEKNVE